MGFQYDEVYVGTPEERAAQKHADDPEALNKLDMGTNVLQQPVGTHELPQYLLQKFGEGTYSERREKILNNIKDIREQISLAENEEEKDAFKLALKHEIKALSALNDVEEEECAAGDTTTGSPDDLETGMY
jgi:hypothetical protein